MPAQERVLGPASARIQLDCEVYCCPDPVPGSYSDCASRALSLPLGGK